MHTLTRITPYLMPGLAFSGIFILACCSQLPDPYQEEVMSEALPERRSGLELATQNLGPDPHEIGPSWYDYEPRTHVLTPKLQVFELRAMGEPISAFRITSYYDERGESGTFTLEYRRAGNPEVNSLTLPSIKTAPVCLNELLELTDCTHSSALLVWRIASRVLPGAGFTVNEPGIYLNQPHDPENPPTYTLHVFGARSLSEVEEGSESAVLPSSMDPARSRVGWVHPSPTDLTPRQDIHIHATSTQHVTQWQVHTISKEGDNLNISLQIMCQEMDIEDQAPFEPTTTKILSVTIDTSTDYQAKLMSLCDPDMDTLPLGQIMDTSSVPYGALWPAEPFDLYIEQIKGRISMRPGPGTLLQNWTLAYGEGSTTFGPVELDVIWENAQ